MKIYTGTGDRGKTSLFSGERISKADTRIDAYGDLDELNSILGALTAQLSTEEKLVAELQQIQSSIFQAGAWLATLPNAPSTDSLQEISPGHTIVAVLQKPVVSDLPETHTGEVSTDAPTKSGAELEFVEALVSDLLVRHKNGGIYGRSLHPSTARQIIAMCPVGDMVLRQVGHLLLPVGHLQMK